MKLKLKVWDIPKWLDDIFYSHKSSVDNVKKMGAYTKIETTLVVKDEICMSINESVWCSVLSIFFLFYISF